MGENLFEQIVKSTGLPEEMISQGFLRMISDKGLDKATITLDQIREILAEYLQDVIINARSEFK